MSMSRSFPWCVLWFLCWTKDLSQPILESLPSLQFLFTFLYMHGTSLTYCSYVCRLWNKGWFKALEFFLFLFCTLCLSFLGCRFSSVARAPSSFKLSSLNFSVSFVASWRRLGAYLSPLLKRSLLGHCSLFLPSLLQDVLKVCVLSPLCRKSFSFFLAIIFSLPCPKPLSLSLLLKLSFSRALKLSFFLPSIEALFLSFLL